MWPISLYHTTAANVGKTEQDTGEVILIQTIGGYCYSAE